MNWVQDFTKCFRASASFIKIDSASRTLLEGQMSFHRCCHYFLEDLSEFQQRKRFSGNCIEFLLVRQNRSTGIDTLTNCVPGTLPAFSMFFNRFGKYLIHKNHTHISMNDFEFYKNRQNENYTLLRGGNDLLLFDIYCPIERNSV